MVAADVEAGLEEQTTEVAPEEEKPRRRALLALMALVLLILLTCCCWAWSQLREIPDVVGMTEQDARATLDDAGFEVMATLPDDEATDGEGAALTGAPGTVLAQSPRAGKRYIKGTTVTITVAPGSADSGAGTGKDGPSMTTLPDVSAGGGNGAAGDSGDDDWSVSGSGGTGAQVPSAQNKSESAARTILESAGYRMVVGGYGPTTAGVTEGNVYFQNPAPGTVLARGATITVWISTGAPHEDGYEGVPYPGPTNP